MSNCCTFQIQVSTGNGECLPAIAPLVEPNSSGVQNTVLNLPSLTDFAQSSTTIYGNFFQLTRKVNEILARLNGTPPPVGNPG